jgi:hypothetical protein
VLLRNIGRLTEINWLMSAESCELTEELNKRAAECRRLAAITRDSKAKQTLLTAAEMWEALALARAGHGLRAKPGPTPTREKPTEPEHRTSEIPSTLSGVARWTSHPPGARSGDESG